MRYETVFILTPVLSDDQMKEAVAKFSKVLTDADSEIIATEEWGLKTLAYPIAKKSTGYYVLIEFEAAPTTVKKLDTAFRRDERVIRFLTFRLDKYAKAYAEKRRMNRAKAAAAPAEPQNQPEVKPEAQPAE